ncbi:ty3-gypsy retrotransposon protein [Cucumis melo var. makuwa]|uniref:Ty3-gypsy retrotransposon protein n=1 Tax=Cucumis melo var. makuwa TaxID=1194695 RepID=A0A5A7TKF6_CUCMM|nr:ty3-gypsy retrotransposon protein [Cucumis melo var. makuwa]TYK17857.1 ty3-gypsy retrotransposon protein [Cucumis melo var. makuwa]
MADIIVEAEMERKINLLIKVVEERDHEITTLREQMQTRETAESSQTPIVKATDKGKNVNFIRAQYGGPRQTSFMYFKPYTKRINNLRMPFGYQPLNSSSSMERATQSSTSPTSSKHARMQDKEKTTLLGSSFEA